MDTFATWIYDLCQTANLILFWSEDFAHIMIQ